MSRRPISFRALARAVASLACVVAGAGCAVVDAGVATTPANLFFDDFSYAQTSDLAAGGWQVRNGVGHPGLPGGRFGAEAITLVDDSLQPGNRVLRMTARTDGTGPGTVQAQLCHQRKYLQGTYAARIRFSDAPRSGVDGDPVIESFYAVAPLAHAFDPDFSELDWEYLPNGGWGVTPSTIFVTSWETFRSDPWIADNAFDSRAGSLDGWHVLVLQVAYGRMSYYLDGARLATHGGKYYPEVPMSIDYNLWFIQSGQIAGHAVRTYQEDVDWAYHAAGVVLSPAQVTARVARLRRQKVAFRDTVSPATPPLASPCNF